MPSDGAADREALLCRAAAAGDERAWRLLYDQSFDAVHRYLWWRCGSRRDLADEAAQETWLIAVRRLRDFDSRRGRFVDWVRGIAAGVLRNQLRRERRRGRRRSLAEGDALAREREDGGEAVIEALAALPEHYEQVLRDKYVDRLTVAEIARRQGRSIKAAESLLTRAREAFRHAYAPSEDHHACR